MVKIYDICYPFELASEMIKEEGPEWFHNFEARAVRLLLFFFYIYIFFFAHNMMKFLDLFINFTHLANPKLPKWYGIRIKWILHWLLVGFVFVSSAMHACSAPLLDFTRPTCLRWHPRQKTAQLERSPWCSAPPPSLSPLEMSAERTLLCSSSSADHHLPAAEGMWGRGGERDKDS